MADSQKKDLMKKYYEEKILFKQAFQSKTIGKLSFTTDLWTSTNQFAIMAVTATWLTHDFQMKEAILAFREIKGSHCGKNIANMFFEVLEEFDIVNKVIE